MNVLPMLLLVACGAPVATFPDGPADEPQTRLRFDDDASVVVEPSAPAVVPPSPSPSPARAQAWPPIRPPVDPPARSEPLDWPFEPSERTARAPVEEGEAVLRGEMVDPLLLK